jgi:hypothetical protein
MGAKKIAHCGKSLLRLPFAFLDRMGGRVPVSRIIEQNAG